MNTRALVSLVSAALLAVALPGLAGAQEGEQIRTEVEGIYGYNASVHGSPFSILFFERVIPIPTDPGEPQFEMTYAHTSTRLLTGPQARALASSVWPGPALGDGFSTVCQCPQHWPARAEATYPGGEQRAEQTAPGGGGMTASALGLDVVAHADTSDPAAPEAAATGKFRSTSISTVRDGVNIATVDASAEDVSMLGGTITFDSVRTTLRATSDGQVAATQGKTEVSGLTIAGQGYTVDENGLRPVQDGDGGETLVPLPSTPPGADQLREQLGIEVELAAHDEQVEGASARRSAGGLRITVDTNVLRSRVPLRDIIAPLPEEVRLEIEPLVQLSPRTVYIFGRGAVAAAASPPFTFDAPPPPPPAAVPPSLPGSSGDIGLPTSPGLTSSPPLSSAPPTTAGEPVPQVAAPPVPATTSGGLPELFGGLPIGLVLLGLGATGLGARGLSGLTGAALAAGGGGLCSRGAVKGVPDLRTSEV